jgi:hypothetical protein
MRTEPPTLFAALVVGCCLSLPQPAMADGAGRGVAERRNQQIQSGISWVASYDQALERMGANETPVILYFTYDG